MKPLFILISFFFLALTSCDKKVEIDPSLNVPSCIETKVKNDKEKIRELWKYSTSESVYYYFLSECCDAYNYLYDSQCNKICALDGGLSGKGDGKCPQFPKEIEKTLVWKK